MWLSVAKKRMQRKDLEFVDNAGKPPSSNFKVL